MENSDSQFEMWDLAMARMFDSLPCESQLTAEGPCVCPGCLVYRFWEDLDVFQKCMLFGAFFDEGLSLQGLADAVVARLSEDVIGLSEQLQHLARLAEMSALTTHERWRLMREALRKGNFIKEID